jgi:hypothetical protein
MGEFIEMLKRPRRESVIWLDSHNYAGRLLAGGAPPWLEVAAFVAWQRKTQGLLKSSVASLPLAPVVAAWLEVRPELRVAMGAKTRSVYPLKVLLADEPLREHLVEMASGMRSAVGGVLALALPSPRAWVALAYRQGHTETIEVSEDEADSASVYVADFLRAFGGVGLDALLLQETPEEQPASIQDLLAYQAVYNVAVHYKWDVGLQLPGPAALSGAAPTDVAFVISGDTVFDGLPHGIALAHDFWKGVEQPAIGGANFHFAEIPENATPERVLERLASLS